MEHYICKTCGIQYSEACEVPSICSICQDERQYVSLSGQTWTTLDEMLGSKEYSNEIVNKEKGVYSITTKPTFAIGQSAYLIQTGDYNVLWDCISYLDEQTIDQIYKLGGIDVIALSHPHYYSTQIEWAEQFDTLIYIHEDDREWVVRNSERIVFWSGESLELYSGVTLYRMGGHFKGATILHWAEANENKGNIFTGDIIRVTPDQKWVSFMYSYPNFIPLSPARVKEMTIKLEQMKFDRVYDAFMKVIHSNAYESVQKSGSRYMDAIKGVLQE